jgi:hypothetical protein
MKTYPLRGAGDRRFCPEGLFHQWLKMTNRHPAGGIAPAERWAGVVRNFFQLMDETQGQKSGTRIW